MKKAVIVAGGKQHLVAEGDKIKVNLLATDKKTVDFPALMVVDGKSSKVGTPEVSGVKVSAKVLAADVKADKVTAIRYKAKKRVHTLKGHRQRETELEITSIK